MQKFCETKDKPPFNWIEAIRFELKLEQDSRDQDDFYRDPQNVERWAGLTNRAASWVTCACGNLCDILPRYHDGEPVHPQLGDAGMEFYRAVDSQAWSSALGFLNEIDMIALDLIENVYGVNYPQPLTNPLTAILL